MVSETVKHGNAQLFSAARFRLEHPGSGGSLPVMAAVLTDSVRKFLGGAIGFFAAGKASGRAVTGHNANSKALSDRFDKLRQQAQNLNRSHEDHRLCNTC